MKNLIKIIGSILIIVAIYFGVADHVIGFLNRSTKGTFNEEGYTSSLDEKSDLLPYDMILLPDTDLKGKKIHAYMSFHSYNMAQTQPNSLNLYEYIDDNSLTVTFNELEQYKLHADNDDVEKTVCKGGTSQYMIVKESTYDQARYYVVDAKTKEKHTINEYDEYLIAPQVIGDKVYYEKYTLKNDEIDATSICTYNLKTKERNENFFHTQGTIMLMDVMDGKLLYKLYDFTNDKLYACLQNVNTSQIELQYEINTNYFADNLKMIGSDVYFKAEDDNDIFYLGLLKKGSSEVVYFNTEKYTDSYLTGIFTNGKYYLCTYINDKQTSGDSTFGVLFDINTQHVVKKYSNLRSLGLEGDNVYYIEVNRNSKNEITKTKVVVEDLNYIKPGLSKSGK